MPPRLSPFPDSDAPARANDGARVTAVTGVASMPRRGGRTRLLLAAAGVAMLAAVFGSIGWRPIAANAARLGPWFPLLVGIYTAAQIAFALGWREAFDPVPPLRRFPRLFAVYLSGDSANTLAPGSVAGEPLKVHLLRGSEGGAAALASVTIHKHAELVAQCVFVAAGIGVAFARFPLPPAVKAGTAATAAGLVGLMAFMTFALRRGAYAAILQRLSRWKFLARRLERAHAPAENADAQIAAFYRDHPGRFARSALFCLAGWCGGLLETWIVLRLLAPRAGGAEAFAVEALAMTWSNLFLFLPGRIGGAEGVRVAVFVLLGLPAAQGAAYGLLRRARELAWTIPGLVFLARSGRPAPDARGTRDLPLTSGEAQA